MYIIDTLNTIYTDFTLFLQRFYNRFHLIVVLFSLVGEFSSLEKPIIQFNTDISFNMHIYIQKNEP